MIDQDNMKEIVPKTEIETEAKPWTQNGQMKEIGVTVVKKQTLHE